MSPTRIPDNDEVYTPMCPACASRDILATDSSREGNTYIIFILCQSCKTKYAEIYEFVKKEIL